MWLLSAYLFNGRIGSEVNKVNRLVYKAAPVTYTFEFEIILNAVIFKLTFIEIIIIDTHRFKEIHSGIEAQQSELGSRIDHVTAIPVFEPPFEILQSFIRRIGIKPGI